MIKNKKLPYIFHISEATELLPPLQQLVKVCEVDQYHSQRCVIMPMIKPISKTLDYNEYQIEIP